MSPTISKRYKYFLSRVGLKESDNILKNAEECDPWPYSNDAIFGWTDFKHPVAYGQDENGNCFLVLRFRSKQEQKEPVTAPNWMSEENKKHDYFKKPFVFWAIMERGGSGHLSGMFHCPRLIDGQECNLIDVLGKSIADQYSRCGVHFWRESDLPMLHDLITNNHKLFECCEATCKLNK